MTYNLRTQSHSSKKSYEADWISILSPLKHDKEYASLFKGFDPNVTEVRPNRKQSNAYSTCFQLLEASFLASDNVYKCYKFGLDVPLSFSSVCKCLKYDCVMARRALYGTYTI